MFWLFFIFTDFYDSVFFHGLWKLLLKMESYCAGKMTLAILFLVLLDQTGLGLYW